MNTWDEQTLPPAVFWDNGYANPVEPRDHEDSMIEYALNTLDELNITGNEAKLLERVLRKTYQAAADGPNRHRTGSRKRA